MANGIEPSLRIIPPIYSNTRPKSSSRMMMPVLFVWKTMCVYNCVYVLAMMIRFYCLITTVPTGFSPMRPMYTDMPDAQNQNSNRQKDIPAIDSQKHECRNGKRGTRQRNAPQIAIKVTHCLFASEIPDPIDFIKHHQSKRSHQPPRPIRPRPKVEISENQHYCAYRHLTNALQCSQHLVFIPDILFIILRLMLGPNEIGNYQHEHVNQPHIRKAEIQ